jgi:hypothetical protein
MSEIETLKITQHDDFWCLIDELDNDNSGFIPNRKVVLDAYIKGNLYGLEITDANRSYVMGATNNKWLCTGSVCLLPCFFITENDEVVVIWIHSRARGIGLSKKIIQLQTLEGK